MRRIRLGFYSLGLSPEGDLPVQGGASRYLNDLLNGLPSDQFEVVLIGHGNGVRPSTFASSDGAENCQARRNDSRLKCFIRMCWHRFPRSWRLAVGLTRNTIEIYREFRKFPVDILHTNYAGFEESPIAARLAGIKIVIGTYNVLPPPDYITAPWLQRFVEWLGAKCMDVAIAGAHQIAVEWSERHPVLRNRFVDIPWGIDIAKVEHEAQPPCSRRDLSLPEDDKVLAVVARLHPMKGITYLLQALPMLLARFPNTILLLIGDGPERGDLEKQVASMNLRDNVRFMGWRQDRLRIIPICDAVILPSVYLETWGSALAEAMVLCKPVVATRIGGVPELVADGETGLIVPPRDPSGLATAISRILQNTELARQFGSAGRTRIEKLFRIEQMQQATVQLYKKLFYDGLGN